MNGPDELENLWKNQPVDPAVKGEEMCKIVLQKTEKFDRRIRRRNLREMIAGAFVAVFFTFTAWAQHDPIQRAGNIVIVAGALWIMYYIRRYGAAPPDPNPDQTLDGYQHALVRKYDHQIRLLRGVKFWYLLPLYVGLLIGSVGLLKEQAEKGASLWLVALFPVFYTLFFAFIWWLNEVRGVRKLEWLREQVTSGIQDGETPC